MLKSKKILIGIISFVSILVLILIIFLIINIFKKKDKLTEIKQSIENVFFYLPNNKYDNLNDIPDYCKVSLVFGQDYMKPDTYLNIDDYDTEEKKKNAHNVAAYKKDTILNNVKSLLGNDASINFDMDSDMDYPFLVENGCGYNNKNIATLSYNEDKEYIYSLKEDKDQTYKLYVKWEDSIKDGDNVTLQAKALLAKKNDDGSYNIYADYEGRYLAGTVSSDKNIEDEVKKLFDLKSRVYIFNLKKNKGGYTWVSYEISDGIYDVEKVEYK